MTLMTLSEEYESVLCVAPVEGIWWGLVRPAKYCSASTSTVQLFEMLDNKFKCYFYSIFICLHCIFCCQGSLSVKECFGYEIWMNSTLKKKKTFRCAVQRIDELGRGKKSPYRSAVVADTPRLILIPKFKIHSGVSFLLPFRNSTLGSWIYLRQICFWSQREARPSCFPGIQTLPPM